jgi:hypothetical protein
MKNFNFTPGTIRDIKDAYASRNEFGCVQNSWIYLVDPETMQECKNIWLNHEDKTLSLFNVFCKALKK